MAKKRQAGKKAGGGRPQRPTSERRIKTSYKGRLMFRPGDKHVLDDQVKEARNYQLLLAEQISHLQALLAEVVVNGANVQRFLSRNIGNQCQW